MLNETFSVIFKHRDIATTLQTNSVSNIWCFLLYFQSKNGIKKDLLSILSQKNTKEETEFLKKLISFMECRNTPIERPPMLGYKQSKIYFLHKSLHWRFINCLLLIFQLICIYSLTKCHKWEDTMDAWAKRLGKVFMTTWVEIHKTLPLQPVLEGITKSKF